VLDETGGFGADYTFEATGLVAVMRQAVESARMGWGLCTVAGVAGRGETLDDVNHGFELMEQQDGIRSVIAFN
jgi:S-(hydroxymethyl)glutathione dehydrogenase/alcohol dehydrogenase